MQINEKIVLKARKISAPVTVHDADGSRRLEMLEVDGYSADLGHVQPLNSGDTLILESTQTEEC